MTAIQKAREALEAARESFRTGRGQLSASNMILDALAALDAETEDWLTMENAPKDDTAILAWGNDAEEEEACYRAIVCRIDGERGWWVRGDMPFYPKLWQPLPSPPESRS